MPRPGIQLNELLAAEVRVRNIIAVLLVLAGSACIVCARIAGVHMTEGELLVAYWPLFTTGTCLVMAGAWIWRRSS